jgi:enoyl-CoA hydratase/carnithine racemase
MTSKSIIKDASDPEPNSIQIHKTAEGITTITINHPQRRNAINRPTAQKLTNAFVSFENDPTQKICIFHGANGTFCAGADLQEVAKASNPVVGSKSSALLPVRSGTVPWGHRAYRWRNWSSAP